MLTLNAKRANSGGKPNEGTQDARFDELGVDKRKRENSIAVLFSRVVQLLKQIEFRFLQIIFIMFIILVAVQTGSRYLIERTGVLVWLEEFTRMCLAWGTMVGMIYLLHKGTHFKVEFLDKKLARISKWIPRTFYMLMVLIGVIGLLWSAIISYDTSARLRTAALEWNHSIVFLIPLVFSLLVVIIVMLTMIIRER